MRLAMSIELNRSRSSNQHQMDAYQHSMWPRLDIEDMTTPPPMYGCKSMEFVRSREIPGAMVNLVCQCSIVRNPSRPQAGLENKNRPTLRNSVKKMKDIFKRRQPSLANRSAEVERTEWWHRDSGATELQDTHINELEDQVHELYGDGQVSELRVQRTVCEKRRDASDPEPAAAAYHQDTQQLAAASLIPTTESGHQERLEQSVLVPSPEIHQFPEQSLSSKASSIGLPDLSHSPISPVSSMSSTESQDLLSSSSNTAFAAIDPQSVNIVGQNVIERSTPFDTYHFDKTEQASMRSGMELALQNPFVHQWLENNATTDGGQHGHKASSMNGCSELVLHADEGVHTSSFPWSSWEEPRHRRTLLESIASSIQDLPFEVKRVTGLFEQSPEACAIAWNDEWRSAWDDCEKELSSQDLSAFLHGWSRGMIDHANQLLASLPSPGGSKQRYQEFRRKPVGGSSNEPVAAQESGFALSAKRRPSDHVSPTAENLDGPSVAMKSQKRKFSDGWSQLDARFPKRFDVMPIGQEAGRNCSDAGSMSPPLVHRSHASRASFSSSHSDSATWSFPLTPVRESSFSDEMAIYSRCPVPGCKSTFTGETLDVRKGNHTRHMKTHSGVRFFCKDCASHYNRVDNLLKHRRENHPELGLPAPKKRRPSKREEVCEVSTEEKALTALCRGSDSQHHH